MSQRSQSLNFKVYFLVSNKRMIKGNCSKDMWHAFYKCLEYGIQPKWISKTEYDAMEFDKTDILVTDERKQATINKLKVSKCCIIKPKQLLLHFISGEPIPGRENPAHTTVMQDICICISNLSSEDKRYMQRLMKRMSGQFTTELHDQVTHLVTGSVISVEYEKALNMKIPIVTTEWVKAIWEANQMNLVMPDNEMFDKYKVPMFHNLVVTATNIRKHQKEEIGRLINDNGGTYMGPLDGARVNVVLAPENSPISEKLKYAREVHITCLTLNWVYESIKVGYALPVKDYLLKISKSSTSKSRSTSKRSNVYETPSCSTISSITCDIQQSNDIDKTTIETSTMSNVSTVLDRLTFNEAKSAGPFLNGCNMYLAGFTSDQRDKLNKILDVGCAMRLDDISDILTHVIVGDEDREASELKLLKSTGLCPYILKLEWLEESIKLKQPAPEENFLYEQESSVVQNVTEPSFSLSNNLQPLQKKISEEWTESSNLGQQGLQNTTVTSSDETVQAPHRPVLAQKQRNRRECLIVSNTDDSDINERLFEGLTFVIPGFSGGYNYAVENIVAMNGRIVPGTFVTIPDYAIVPRCGMTLKYAVKEIVTDLFIEDCVNQDRIVEIMYYHRPIFVKKHVLSNCVLTISTYVGVERSYFIGLAKELDAKIFSLVKLILKKVCIETHI